jgi:hypothetical protein
MNGQILQCFDNQKKLDELSIYVITALGLINSMQDFIYIRFRVLNILEKKFFLLDFSNL